MINYDVDILDVSTGEVRTTPMWAGWTQYSPDTYRSTMCDCNLYGYRERGYFAGSDRSDWQWDQRPHETVAYNFLQRGVCDHSMPPKHYRALLAYLDDGRIYDFARQRFVIAGS